MVDPEGLKMKTPPASEESSPAPNSNRKLSISRSPHTEEFQLSPSYLPPPEIPTTHEDTVTSVSSSTSVENTHPVATVTPSSAPPPLPPSHTGTSILNNILHSKGVEQGTGMARKFLGSWGHAKK